ncbi:hypothetical protein E2I00_011208 [Balaenoptera physalus]|uniref:Agouti domain-containing protein n=1 Tax=Balaenoptera physalus TaxID=9770 RepID=A0A643BLP8_BALPH|nr:hypothetical protein E2I00_011208 [Balaenoptera physalus]
MDVIRLLLATLLVCLCSLTAYSHLAPEEKPRDERSLRSNSSMNLLDFPSVSIVEDSLLSVSGSRSAARLTRTCWPKSQDVIYPANPSSSPLPWGFLEPPLFLPLHCSSGPSETGFAPSLLEAQNKKSKKISRKEAEKKKRSSKKKASMKKVARPRPPPPGPCRDSSYCQLSQLAMGVVESGRWHHLMVMMMMMAMMIVPSCYLRSPANSFIPLTLEDFHIFQSSSLEFLDPVAA